MSTKIFVSAECGKAAPPQVKAEAPPRRRRAALWWGLAAIAAVLLSGLGVGAVLLLR
jgi:hypothetical protein